MAWRCDSLTSKSARGFRGFAGSRVMSMAICRTIATLNGVHKVGNSHMEGFQGT